MSTLTPDPRSVYNAALSDPPSCHFCGEEVTLRGNTTKSLVMCNVKGHRVPAHRGCWMSWFVSGGRNPMKREEVKKKYGATMKILWQDEAYRKRVIEGLGKAWEDEERKRKAGLISKRRWQDDKFKERVSATIREALKDPEIREKRRVTMRNLWQSLSSHEKEIRMRKLNETPNESERYLAGLLDSLGFTMNVTKGRFIAGHIPDFIHEELPLIIEYDGRGGHDPKSPWTPDTWEECHAIDDLRDRKYREEGYRVLRLTPEDRYGPPEAVLRKVTKWM